MHCSKGEREDMGMDSVLQVAIVGTAQAGGYNAQEQPVSTSLDQLTHTISHGQDERTLLLTAGAQAIYQQAGQVLSRSEEQSVGAPSERLNPCSIQVAYLLENLLLQKDLHDLLPEALQLLYQHQLRLPFSSLPKALAYGAQNKSLRAALLSVMGERAHWLGTLNDQWAWTTQVLGKGTLHWSDSLPDNAETIWQEGSHREREEVLRRLRLSDPGQAREWLMASWKTEKGETRSNFLATFEYGLSDNDLPFLQQALEDRSETVRIIAASHLARLPNSPQAQRLLKLADTLLSYKHGKIQVAKPEHVDITAEWIQQVTIAKIKHELPDAGWNKKQMTTFWTALVQEALARVPPVHWEERFNLSPQALIAAAYEHPLHTTIIDGWAQAALFHDANNWFHPLLDQFNLRAPEEGLTIKNYQSLLERLPQAEVEMLVTPLLQLDDLWHRVLVLVPAPWSRDFSLHCLEILRMRLRGLTLQRGYGEWYSFWPPVLKKTACSIDPSLFEAALAEWELSPGADWYHQQLQRRIEEFITLVTTRQRLFAALPSSTAIISPQRIQGAQQ
jgi:hypothetical protein